ncbi:Putative zinc-finger [Abditibacterium utsteinense]|uniref:Zinc-finger n=1 Tax=Abditibacterium utsteinense TaxID=1960156 RepID=A0A2S8SVN7_9BACT|nr:zf-HC2 domain-containing protein [Abditibacterium utsteinense]PQV64863.1 Putative zinc-finger [Abditibacterium utsteinense]
MNNTMNRLSNDQIMDYLDGTLSPSETARVDNHLKNHAEDAQMVDELRFAMGAAKQWHESEPLQVSENFWPQLRENLGPVPQRSAWSKLKNQVAGAFGPSRAARLSLGAAFAIIAIAASALLFSPQSATNQAVALSDADKTFIQQSVQKHEAYVQSQPAPGDASSLETGAEEDNEPEIP